MKFLNYLFLPLFLVSNLGYANSLNERQLPKIVMDYIKNERKSCNEITDSANKPGIYNIGNSIKKIIYINHNLEYIVHSSKDQLCSSSSSLYETNGGYYLTIFSNYNNSWQKIFDNLVYNYYFNSPKSSNFPTNIIIHSKGEPGFITNETEFEWNKKNNSYSPKNIKENIYNHKLEK